MAHTGAIPLNYTYVPSEKKVRYGENTDEKITKAIYILPGYMGSLLYHPKTYELLWIHYGKDAFPWFGGDKLINHDKDGITEIAITLGPDVRATQDLEAACPGGKFPSCHWWKDSYGAQDTYEILVKELKTKFESQSNPQDKRDVIFFPYNWLGDINDSAAKLEKDVNVKGYKEIDIVTHSTGGLVASAYIAIAGNKEKVRKLIMIAPPLFGTYASFIALEKGYSRSIPYINSADSFSWRWWVQAILINSPNAYQLLPSKEYFEVTKPALERNAPNTTFGGDTNRPFEDFYEILKRSDNLNYRLLYGNQLSHEHFRTVSLDGMEDKLLAKKEDVIVIGTAFGYSTPKAVRYKLEFDPLNASKIKKSILDEIQYDQLGDGTIYHKSLGIDLGLSDDRKRGYIASSKFNTYLRINEDNMSLPDILPDHTALAKIDKKVKYLVVDLLSLENEEKLDEKINTELAKYGARFSAAGVGIKTPLNPPPDSERFNVGVEEPKWFSANTGIAFLQNIKDGQPIKQARDLINIRRIRRQNLE